MANEELKIGVSGATGKPLFAAPEDAGRMTLPAATKMAAEAGKQMMGKDVRVPSDGELGQVFNALASTGMRLAAATYSSNTWQNPYWSSTDHTSRVWRFGLPQPYRKKIVTAACSRDLYWSTRNPKTQVCNVRFVRS
jgi:hypothetical protein